MQYDITFQITGEVVETVTASNAEDAIKQARVLVSDINLPIPHCVDFVKCEVVN
jgi:hypothetical protein